MRAFLTLAFTTIAATAGRAQVVESWRTPVDHSPWWDFPIDADFAPDGTTTYCGFEDSGPIVPPSTLRPAGASVVRIDPQGNVLWSDRYDGPNPAPHNVRFKAGALHADGGWVGVTETIPLPTPTSNHHVEVVRYDAAGTRLWTTFVPDAIAWTITIARDGDVWVAGSRHNGGGWADAAVWRFGPNGGLLSTALWDGTGHGQEEAYAIATDGAGGVYVGGTTNGGVGSTLRMLLRVGPAGNVLWSRPDGFGPGAVGELVADSSGVYVASTIPSGNGAIGVLTRYDLAGTPLWERDLSAVASTIHHPSYVAFAPNGDVVGASGRGTVTVRRFDPSGNLRWSTVVTTGPGDAARGLAVNARDETVCGGTRDGATPYGGFVAKLAPTGTLQWLRTVPGLTALEAGAGPPGAGFLIGYQSPAADNLTVLTVRFDDWVVPFCAGDGEGTACPCGNSGAHLHGCANSAAPAGALLGASGAPLLANDTFALHGSGMPNGPVAYFQGTTSVAGGAGSAFGDGKLCLAGSIVRLGTKQNAGGASSFPGPSDPSISTLGGIAGGMQIRTYQAWYRDVAPFCTPDGFNLTNALIVTWSP